MFGTSRLLNLKNLFWFLGYLSIVYLVTVLCAPRSAGTHWALLLAEAPAPSKASGDQSNRSRIKNLFSDPLKGWDGKGPNPTSRGPIPLTPQGRENPIATPKPVPSPTPSELPSTEASTSFPALQGESHPGMDAETLYAEAVIAYNTQKPDESLRLLDQVLRLKPSSTEALEMKALILRTKNSFEEALRTYLQLMKIKPLEERAPYHFEAGLILFNQKKLGQAKFHLEIAAQAKFNRTATHFFLGMIAFNTGENDEALEHFRLIVSEGQDELKLASVYYLGILHSKLGQGSEATYRLVEARALAMSMKDVKIAQDILKGVNKALEPYKGGQIFLNASIVAQWDGNVALQSAAASASVGASGLSTFKTIFAGGLGFMTSPLGALQVVGSYRGTFNKNFSEPARVYEFATNTVSTYLSLFPLSRFNFALKAEGTLAFKYYTADTASSGSAGYYLFYYLGDFGPVVKIGVAPQWTLTLDSSFRPQRYPNDTDRDGFGVSGRASLRFENTFRFFNPSGYLGYDYNKGTGANFVFGTVQAGFSNSIRFSSSHFLNQSLDFNLSTYPQAGRTDQLLGFRLNWLKNFTPKIGAVADFGLTRNFSSSESDFGYFQPVVGAGVSFTL